MKIALAKYIRHIGAKLQISRRRVKYTSTSELAYSNFVIKYNTSIQAVNCCTEWRLAQYRPRSSYKTEEQVSHTGRARQIFIRLLQTVGPYTQITNC